MMALYLVEHRLPCITDAELRLLQAALSNACDRLSARGEPVRHVCSTYLPGSRRLLSLFQAAAADAVRKVTENAQAPLATLEPAMAMPNVKED